MKARLANDGAEAVVSTPAEFAALIKAEIEKWSALAKAANIQPEEVACPCPASVRSPALPLKARPRFLAP